jgi:hypothetical protein
VEMRTRPAAALLRFVPVGVAPWRPGPYEKRFLEDLHPPLV